MLVLALALALATGSCSRDGGDGPGDSSTTAPATTTTSPPSAAADPIAIGWDVDEAGTELPDGWSLHDAEGDGPFLEVRRQGQVVGLLETTSFPVESIETLRGGAGDDASRRASLRAYAETFVATFRADRAEGCGADYGYDPAPIVVFDAPDGPVVAYGFSGTLADGSPSEGIAAIAGIQDDQLVLVTGTASDEGGCLPAEGTVFSTADLDAFRPLLERIGAGSGVPAPANR
jgi:hypothetical protein